MASGNNCSSKWRPKFNEANYENWKRDIEIWCELCELTKTKQALAIHLSFNGRARIASSEINITKLKIDTGVKTYIEKLDGLILSDKGRRNSFHNLYNLCRTEDKSKSEFISEFEHAYYKL